MTLTENPRLLSYLCNLVSGVGIIHIKFSAETKQISLFSKIAGPSKWNKHISAVLVFIALCQWVVADNKLSLGNIVAGVALL